MTVSYYKARADVQYIEITTENKTGASRLPESRGKDAQDLHAVARKSGRQGMEWRGEVC